MIRKALPLLTLAAVLAACGGPEGEDFRDRTGPRVLEVAPADGATGVPIDTEITIKFSESILVRKKLSGGRVQEFDFGGFVATDADGKPVAGFITFNNDALVFRPASGLANSMKYSFTVNERVKDLFGNPAKPFSWSFETEADRTAPTAPYNLIYPSLTNQASVEVEGSMDPASTLIVNGKTSVKHPKTGTFALTFALAEGANDFAFSAVDDAGNESAPVEIAITRDSIPPAPLATCAAGVLQWHAGLRSGCWNPPAVIAWNKPNVPIGGEWTPGANDVAYFSLGNQLSPACTAGRCEFDGFNPRLLGSGTVKLRAYSVDQAGNENVAFERDFRYDAVPPALSLTSALPAIFKPGQLGLAATTTTLTAGSLTLAKEAGARYFAAVDGVAADACAAAATACTLAYAGLADGVHRFAATATDAAGNETRLTKFVTVDTRAPRVYMLPGTGATPSGTPTFHVFADEAVTTGTLQVGAQTLAPASDATSRGRHWTFGPPSPALAGTATATVWVYDAAGNATLAATTFSATGGFPLAATAYAGFTTGGTGRDGGLTLTGLTAPLSVAFAVDGGAPGSYALAVTTGGALALSLDALSRVSGTVRAYTDDGGVAAFANLPADPWNHGAPAIETLVATTGTFGPVVGAVLPIPGGFGFFSDEGFAYWFDGAGPRTEGERFDFITGCGTAAVTYPYPPLVALDATWALLGWPCPGLAPGVSVVKLDPAALAAGTTWPRWSPPQAGDYKFGLALTGAAFYGTADRQIAVGAPNGTGSLYLYAATSATAPAYRLVGDETVNARFGESAAFAAGHHAGKAVLGIVAPDEPAVYFFDEDIYANQSFDPLGLYRVRAALPAVNTCIVGARGRHEIVNVGNLDGDAEASDDLVAASWADNCAADGVPNYEVVLHIFLGGRGAAGADPIVVRQLYRKTAFAGAMPRIVPLGDLNGDARADFGFVDTTNNAMVRVYYGAAAGLPESRLIYAPATTPPGWWVLGGTADADGDARPDLILSLRYLDQRLMSRP